ncbi:hypothetical protein LTR48_001247 [Friedmanniomyces endolithicus]|uniref:4-hydroxy-4-methyl-2-oxoglutarate aldolase n=1 Tax=Rachicladosporium monterosium TaxID=1507873 RepID=A0ABR0LE18_9PEZI|nr:hypothetical protein LTS09_009851 [Friedmanniomyces endolithicus]KAK0936416.1 hypothetical protein LTR29_011983 [Friedmanniomyces endolithicus]KAK1093984.1 hypothetical protein LTR48_001247 [Friedmanniomyces endolithicus]KAK1821516.1 hypothetical protein LTR12_004077 [Friedmanniomyces endolithicus]KAK5147447.1 hypothetical protein LTR32_001104 [Rachicladosporium monterosium]
MNVKAVVKALEAYTSCDVADALSKLKVPHGGFLAGLTMWSPKRQDGPTKVVGPAYTVRYVRKNYENEPQPSGHYVSSFHQHQYSDERLISLQIDSIPSGSVVFISAPARSINACYGGLMSTRAKYSGAVGTIVDGRLRDLQEHRDLDYPVFARDVGTTAPAETMRVAAINEPVRLNSDDQDAVINPGDILVGDLNGVVCIPQHLAEKVVELIPSQLEADEKVAADIKNGRLVAESMKEHRSGVKKR